jgi:hypothetical protein
MWLQQSQLNGKMKSEAKSKERNVSHSLEDLDIEGA